MKVRSRHVFSLLMSSLVAVGASANAEPETDAKHAIRALYSYGSCVVDFSPSRTRRILTMVPGSKEEQSLLRSVADDRCINGHGGSQYLFFEPAMLRGAIAEAILHLDEKRGGKGKATDVPAPFAPLSPKDLEGLSSEGKSTLLVLDVAQCLVASDAQDVAALLETYPTSQEEGQAFGKLVPHLGPCIPNGKQVTLAKPRLRGALAEAVYRSGFVMAQAPR